MDQLADLLAGQDPHVVIADDDAASRALLRVILEREGATVVESADGRAALANVRRILPHVVLLDVQMPPPDGITLLRILRESYSEAELPVILVTGRSDTASKIAGLEAGASDFVTKPYEPSELVARVRAALRTRFAFDRLESSQAVLAALANAVEAKDPGTEHHCSRLADVAFRLARRAGAKGAQLEAIMYGALLHDVGKIGVSEAVIRKAGSLEATEWAEMRRHPLIGADIVEPLRLGRLVAPIVRGHHERWDGRGYPDRLHGTEIPFGARIVSVVDSYDAMTSDRPYRRAMTPAAARKELAAHAGTQFDPDVVDLFLAQLTDRHELDRRPDPGDFGYIRAFRRGLTAEPAHG